jgi:MFS family permease
MKGDKAVHTKLDAPARMRGAGSGFGRYGRVLISMEAVLMWVSSGSIAHGLNVILPAIAKVHGLNYAQLLAFATPASWMSVVSGYWGAKLCQKIGAKSLIVAGLLLGGVSFGCMGLANSVWAFAALFAMVCVFDTTFAFIGGPAMIASWFPEKRSAAMGWVTMGQTISSATYVPLIAMVFAAVGVERGFWVIPALMAIAAMAFLWLPAENPLQWRCAEKCAERVQEADLQAVQLTTRQLLGMRDVWLMGVSYGGLFIVIVGVISQLVPRLISLGMTEPQAIQAMTIAAVTGIPGAWAWGALGQRYGVKRSSILYALWYVVAITLHLVNWNKGTLWLSLLMIGFGLSGITNYSVSVVGERFQGRQFVSAWSVVNPIQSVLRCCAFAILAFGIHSLGGFRGAYLILVGVGLISAVLITRIREQASESAAIDDRRTETC